jgi:drug/metabolite transporter (DMT)-like permease
MGIVAALIGALIVIRPGSEVFSPAAVLPLIGAFFYAGFALATRKVGRSEDPMTSLLYAALLGTAVLSVAVVPVWVRPDGFAVFLMLAIGALGALGQILVIRALMLAEASAVAPFSYIGLIFAALWGALFFGEYPDLATYVGAGIIAVAGIYVWHRETREARRP